MNTEIQIKAIGRPQRDLLVTVYDQFDPLDAALGLPPRTVDARHKWIGSAMSQIINLAALSPAGEVVGHCFLAADKSGSAEIAVFVHQETRRRGIATP